MPLLLARSWGMGNTMLNSVDMSVANMTLDVSTAQSKTEGRSLRLASSSSLTTSRWIRWALEGDPDHPSFSIWIYLTGTNNVYTDSDVWAMALLLGTGEYIQFRWNGTTHTFDAYVNNALVASGTIEVSNAGWFHLQADVTIADAGNITVLIDGHESINWSGDTQPGIATGATYLYWQSRSAGGAFGTMYLDCLVASDGEGLLGDLRIYEKRPDADDATAQWAPSAGSDNYAVEDETPASDADYNEADTDGLIDQFELSALDITGLTCEAVIAWCRAQMTDGVGDNLDVGISSGGTPSVKRSPLSTSWEYYFGDVEAVDPDDSAAWDQTKLDALLHRKVAVIA